MKMDSPIFWRGLERCLVIIGAICFGYLGSNLYLSGVKSTPFELNTQIPLPHLLVTGAGPGAIFMVFGVIIMIIAIYTGRARAMRPGMRPKAPNAAEAKQNR
jgi:hypothetical protein